MPQSADHPRIRTLFVGAMACCGLLLGSCGASQWRTHTIDLPPTSPGVAFSIENFRGDVEIRVMPKAQRVTIDAEVEVDESWDTEQQEKELARVAVLPEMQDQDGRTVVKVVTTTTRPDLTDHRVNLKIITPRCEGLEVTSRDGTILAVNTQGATRIANRGGAIEFRTSKAMTDPVTLTTVDGNIYYQVPPGSSAAFDLETLKGEVTVADRTTGIEQAYSTPKTYNASLNEGDNPVLARTNEGDIFVWVIKDPVALTRTYKKTLPNPMDFINKKGSRRWTRNLPDDHPEVQGRIRLDPVR